MKTLLIGINSKYIHPTLSIYQLAYNTTYPVTLKEFTIKDINHRTVLTNLLLQMTKQHYGALEHLCICEYMACSDVV